MILNNTYFEELKEQITNQEKWDRAHFHVFNHEAGTGKSRSAHQIIGEMAKDHPFRVLYVQRFVRDDELDNTVLAINQHAGKTIAERFAKEDTQKEVRKKRAEEAQVLCITHKMYSQICKDEHQELIRNRQILIIDEYPDLLERITVSLEDICYLWGYYPTHGFDVIEELAKDFREKLYSYESRALTQIKTMELVEFNSTQYEKYRTAIPAIKKKISDKAHEKLLNKFEQVMKNGCFFYEGKFYTFDNQYEYKMLNNNIILDANAGFDFRYELFHKFIVRNQDKVFDYSNSTFMHFEINTGKKDLAQYINFPEKVLDTISLEDRKSVLLITDMANKENVEGSLCYHFSQYGDTLLEIENRMSCKFSVDYFGNIIGVNQYRDYDTVVVMKTPNFDYLTYALTYLFYQTKNNRPVESVPIFSHDGVENIRKATVAGEIYQAIKRINRDNSQNSQIYVFTSNQDAIDIVLYQLPNIQYRKEKMDLVSKRKYDSSNRKESSLFEKNIEQIKNLLIELKGQGISSVKKKELREKVGVSDPAYFSKILGVMGLFFEQLNIINSGQKLILIHDPNTEDLDRNLGKSA
ncbi:hypothetical protein [Brevibacillus choshinensis]|uniref:Uncharacterized protein n=1 Tax=Brevibacillus choshinensis TaxID=54911 RepID=A0ABX7FKW9_BRECH|nr:hypothetical protein [Brevibacillus choshinensis]QRG65961.1 hypothetical protein JNE38_20600 [Brevibacillus choshinensis]